MKVDNPEFDLRGEIICRCCPFEGTENCYPFDCPTRETYAEACKLAEGQQ